MKSRILTVQNRFSQNLGRNKDLKRNSLRENLMPLENSEHNSLPRCTSGILADSFHPNPIT
jgi:hypothetical protein